MCWGLVSLSGAPVALHFLVMLPIHEWHTCLELVLLKADWGAT